jgi:hypothetical protein
MNTNTTTTSDKIKATALLLIGLFFIVFILTVINFNVV